MEILPKELTLVRTFQAPKELVYQAWTDPAQVARWWGPDGFTCPVCRMEVRTGGAIYIDMQGPDGTIYPMTGTFREVIPAERLVFTSEAIENGEVVLEERTTVTFTEQDGKTELTVHTVLIRVTRAAEAHVSGMEAGWNQTLDRLVAFIG